MALTRHRIDAFLSLVYVCVLCIAQPSWYRSFRSPYYKETHVKFRKKVRDFVEAEIMPYVHEWDESAFPTPAAKE